MSDENPQEIADFSNYSDDEIRALLKNVILTRVMNLEESPMVLSLAVKLFFSDVPKKSIVDDMTMDEIKQKLSSYMDFGDTEE